MSCSRAAFFMPRIFTDGASCATEAGSLGAVQAGIPTATVNNMAHPAIRAIDLHSSFVPFGTTSVYRRFRHRLYMMRPINRPGSIYRPRRDEAIGLRKMRDGE